MSNLMPNKDCDEIYSWPFYTQEYVTTKTDNNLREVSKNSKWKGCVIIW